MANNDNDDDAPQVYLLGKTYLANNQGQFYIRNDPIVHMAAGDRHTIIVTETGRAFAFGDNTSGQLGLGHTDKIEKVSCIKSLKFTGTDERIVLAACGRESSLVATNHGALYAFGSNIRSQLGFNTSDPASIQSQPKKIDRFKNKIVWKQISMGAEHACALNEDGVVYVWGANDDGQCGQPRKDDEIKVPKELRLDHSVTAISCGNYHTALVSKDGKLFVFGNNDDRQLGRSVPDSAVGPLQVSFTHKVKDVACGHQHTVVLTENGEVYSCGRNDRGQLGLGPSVASAESFELIPGLPKRIQAIAAGEGHTAVLGPRGDIYVFGDGKHGKLGSTTYSNEFEPCIVDKFKLYNVLKVVCGGCQTIVLAKKKDHDQKKSSGSDEDFGNATLSVTQRPKSRARSVRSSKALTDRSLAVGDSMDATLTPARSAGASNHLRVESDDDKSDKELSASMKSATFNQTHTISNGKFLPTQSPSLNRTAGRSNDGELKPLRTGALDRTARLNKDADDLDRTTTRLAPLDKSPMRNTRFDRSSPQPLKKIPDSDEDKSSSDEKSKPVTKRSEQSSPPLKHEPKRTPAARQRDDSESDDHKPKSTTPRSKVAMSETLTRKTRPPSESEEEESEEEEEESENDRKRVSSRQPKQAPPPAVRRSSLPSARSGKANTSVRDGNQTIGSRPSDNARGSFRSQANKTLAKPTTSNANTSTPTKETPAAQQPGFFSRLFGSKPAPPPAQSTPSRTPAPAAPPASRACSVM
ncbi:unnamed protein product [Adineta ricciae]|uniref:RCC1-like domain-containing protein n=1 Tax=Adineta ricciae TaxID=249248 RepID=A0A815KJF6_ADIRI|nr:unnamed protein product [Adineta ricciae]